ncbi:tektin-2 [Contarinia nasturtii]|uniref:tektin-2 n=1 Tax=Contarinia nasturtii TaxID=265458 RepID=UPI0012D49265|nr:tektin-2 [Contarinia nasturtii]XP_031616459.1 tektin-2 [Contarinia nasturtii]
MSNSNYYRPFEKPLQHLGIDDWRTRTNHLCNLASVHRTNALDLIQTSRSVRDENQVQAHFNTTNNTIRLANRVQELDRWYAEIRLCLDHLLKEINLLRLEKSLTESTLDALSLRLSVATECLSMRDHRVHGELTQDDANVELKRELATVESSVKMLADQCQRAWEQLNRLNEVKMKLNLELMHKNEARDCDNQQRFTNEVCSNITFKTDPMRNPRNCCTYDGWLEHTKQIKHIAENEMESSCRMRESLFVAREKTKNSLENQQELTEHTLRKRIFDTQRARNEFEWQIIKNKNEMKILLNEIEQIESALESNAKATKLAETRLENRCQRPGMELCMDGVYNGLCDEIKQLQFAQHQLNEKLSISKASYNQLELNLKQLDADLKKKQHTLDTDIRALDLRQRLKMDASEDITTENRQMTLTNLQQET